MHDGAPLDWCRCCMTVLGVAVQTRPRACVHWCPRCALVPGVQPCSVPRVQCRGDVSRRALRSLRSLSLRLFVSLSLCVGGALQRRAVLFPFVRVWRFAAPDVCRIGTPPAGGTCVSTSECPGLGLRASCHGTDAQTRGAAAVTGLDSFGRVDPRRSLFGFPLLCASRTARASSLRSRARHPCGLYVHAVAP